MGPDTLVLGGFEALKSHRFVLRQSLLLHENARVGVLLVKFALSHERDALRSFFIQLLHSLEHLRLDVYESALGEVLEGHETLHIDHGVRRLVAHK